MSRDRDAYDFFEPKDRGRFGDNEHEASKRGPRVGGASDLVDLLLFLQVEKERAIAVTDPAKKDSRWIWLPRSQIEFEMRPKGCITVTLPHWLAKEKGLV